LLSGSIFILLCSEILEDCAQNTLTKSLARRVPRHRRGVCKITPDYDITNLWKKKGEILYIFWCMESSIYTNRQEKGIFCYLEFSRYWI